MKIVRLACIAWMFLLAGCSDGESSVAPPTGGGTIAAGAELGCLAGELQRDDGSCQRAGVPSDGCGPGFVHDGDGGCVATLPAQPCSPGDMALPGESNCHSITPCATGTWGDIPVASDTEYVDASYTLGLNDGSTMRPWTTIQEAVNAAAPGAVVAIAAGTYGEHVFVDKPLALWGVCPDKVVIAGVDNHVVQLLASGASLHRVTVTGGFYGVLVAMAEDVLLDGLWIHDTLAEGVYLHHFNQPTSATLRDSLVEATLSTGISVFGSALTIERTVVRNIEPLSSGEFGRGINTLDDGIVGFGATLIARNVIVEDTYEVGIALFGTDAVVEDTLVRRTESSAGMGFFGTGIEVLLNKTTGMPSSLELRRSVIEDSHHCGVCMVDSLLEVEATSIRDTHPEGAEQGTGFGMRALDEMFGEELPAIATIKASSIHRSHKMGVAVVGADVEAEALLVRDTAAAADTEKFGRGIGVEPSSHTLRSGSLVLRGGVIENSHEVGVLVLGGHGELDSILVRDVHPRPADDAYGAGIVFHLEPFTRLRSDGTVHRAVVERAYAAGLAALGADVVAGDIIATGIQPQVGSDDFGDGVVASAWVQFLDELFPTSMHISRATVTGNARAGIASFAANVSVERTIADCNTIHLDAEQLEDLPAIFEDRGLNLCGCGAESVTCKVLSSNLTPPPSLPP